MYQVIKNVINSGDYELEALLSRIDTMFVREKITEEQEVELIRLARENADPVNSYAPLQKRVDALYTDNGEHYICTMNGCVWAPDVYPSGWTKQENIEETQKESNDNA